MGAVTPLKVMLMPATDGCGWPMILYAVTSPCTPGAMPLPLMMAIEPGDITGRKLAALVNVTLVGPGRREVRLKVALKVDVIAVTTIGPAVAPAVTVGEACPLTPV